MPERLCECSPEKPQMVCVPVGGRMTRYYVCPECGTVRVEHYRTLGGAVDYIMRLELNDALVPAAVKAQARAILKNAALYHDQQYCTP